MGGSTYSNLFPLEGIYSKLISLPVYHTSCSTMISVLINVLYDHHVPDQMRSPCFTMKDSRPWANARKFTVLMKTPFPISSWPYGMLECFEKTNLSHHLGIMLYEVEMLSLQERVYVLNQRLCFFFNSNTGVRIKMFMWGILISYQTTYLQNVCFCFLFPRFLGLLFNFSTKWHNLMALLN